MADPITGTLAAVAGITSLVGGGIGMASGMKSAKQGPGIGPLFSELQGNEQQAAYNTEAGLLGRQADFAREQSERVAQQKEAEGKSFKEQQSLDFISSGLGSLAGSPMSVLTDTQQKVDEEAAAIRRRGMEESGLLSMQGLQMLRKGSAAAFGGFADALQSRFSAKVQSQQLKAQAWQAGLKGVGGLASAGAAGFGALGKGGSSAPSASPSTKLFSPSSFNILE